MQFTANKSQAVAIALKRRALDSCSRKSCGRRDSPTERGSVTRSGFASQSVREINWNVFENSDVLRLTEPRSANGRRD